MDENRKKALAVALGQIEKQFGKGSGGIYIRHRPTNLRHRRPDLLFHNLPTILAPKSGLSHRLVAFTALSRSSCTEGKASYQAARLAYSTGGTISPVT